MSYLTGDCHWVWVGVPPTKNVIAMVLSKDGVASIGTFDASFHVAWAALPKIPPKLKEMMKAKS